MSDEMLTEPAAVLPLPVDAPPGRRGRWLVPLVAGLAGLVVGAGGVGLVWGLSSSPASRSSAKVASSASPMFTLTGTMTLTGLSGIRASDGQCAGRGGFDDIAEGTGVTVYDGGGQVVGNGKLDRGVPIDGACRFMVFVEKVPDGPKFYQVEVSHRGKLTLSAQDAKAGKFAGTL